MLAYYVGLPGSGKTYRAVNYVYDCFIDEKSKDFGKFERFYTNINEFKFEFFNVTKIQAELLDYDKLIIDLEHLRLMFMQKAPDSQLVEKAKELGLDKALFVIDEAHNYYDTKKDVLLWWLTYHRHLHQDIILITQNLSLIYRQYLKIGEFFYRAVPSSLRLRSGVFTYHQFVDYKLTKTSHTDTIKLKFNKDVFELYSSGANIQSKKVIYKFIILGALLFFFTFGVFWAISSSYKSDSNSSSSPAATFSKLAPPVVLPSNSFTVVCVDFDCSFKGRPFSLTKLNGYVKQYGLIQSGYDSSNGITFFTYANNDKFFKEVIDVPSVSNSSN